MYISAEAMADWDKQYRAAFVNSLTGYKPANLVGTCSAGGQENLAIMSSAVHLGSHPPLIMLVLRPDVAPRHTLDNIRATGHYTLSHVHETLIEPAHQTAARYPREQSEFTACGLTPAYREGFAAPYVKEAFLSLGLSLREEQRLAINGTHMVIGEVVWVSVPDNALRDDGSIDLYRSGSVALAGVDSYYAPQPLCRMAYAKPDLPPRRID
ncbi:flavin reductase family protein [Litorivivens sp.]|uniref:flavin reductase family protein n=1 Tax=Litorivivens sp. TaxID=2020868 RepID=UPI0035646B7F